MTLQLILMRHAKSGWDDPLADDQDRTLNDRGRGAAPLLGQWLTTQGYEPDHVLCSSAIRTKETWSLVDAELGKRADVEFDTALYLASSDQILSKIQNVTAASRLLVMGHNPGIGYLAAELMNAPAPHPQFSRYPTAATTVLEFDAESWNDIGFRAGTVIDFAVPRDLA